ncbi:MAG: mandelate racemase/muconate lactonizing enzyme family protein [Desulfobacterales bacterium]|nr:mandelate racemase/muconate lactonizing enzyme family protein [Desulfobacterales bacterium]
MKIERVKATAVSIPFDAPYTWSVGEYTGITRVIVEVFTDDGIVGLGEAPSWECEAEINGHMAQRLIGADPFDIENCELRCVPETRVLANTDSNTPLKAFGGIEMALWDIRGKAWNMPLYKVLGGAVRKEIPFTEYYSFRPLKGTAGGLKNPTDIADYCARMREEHGSTYFEGKCSTGDPRLDIEVTRAVRDAVGDDAMIRLDGNMAWTLASARELVAGLAPFNIRNFEDPVGSFRDMEKLRQHTSIPFSTHTPDLGSAVRMGVPDTFVLNLTALGGISRTLKFIAACEQTGIDFWFYSGDTGLATAAYLQVSAATRHIIEPNQSLFRFMTCDVIQEGPFTCKNNLVSVPEGPGLGVTLDRENMAQCARRFKDEGPMDQYYNPLNPDVYARVPLG